MIQKGHHVFIKKYLTCTSLDPILLDKHLTVMGSLI